MFSKNQSLLHNFCPCHWAKISEPQLQSWCGTMDHFSWNDTHALWGSCLVGAVVSVLLCLPLPVWDRCPVRKWGQGQLGPLYSYPVMLGVEPLPYAWGLGEGKDPSPFLLAMLTRNLASATHSWGGGMINAGVLLLLVRNWVPWLGAERRRSPVRLSWRGDREGVGYGSSATDSQCSYQDLVDFLK